MQAPSPRPSPATGEGSSETSALPPLPAKASIETPPPFTVLPSPVAGEGRGEGACTQEDELLHYEREAQAAGARRVIGIDEAGRGSLAGPVVAAAVVLPEGFDLAGIKDSKKLSPLARERAFARLRETDGVSIGVGIVHAPEIDRINILQATYCAMRLALANLPPGGDSGTSETDAVLVDGLPVPNLHPNCRALVKGDSLSASIAAASIIAKVTRDRLMCGEIHDAHPQYGFPSHKGYGSPTHLAALREFGPCPYHRRSFAPVAQCALLFPDASEK